MNSRLRESHQITRQGHECHQFCIRIFPLFVSSRFVSYRPASFKWLMWSHSIPFHLTTHTHTLSLSLSRLGSRGANMIPSPLPFAPPAFLQECRHTLDHLLDQPLNSHLQCGLPTCITVAWLLVEHGADTTAQSKDGTTPLPGVSEWGHVDVAR